ncbi:MAG: universal stress protein [Negativicutes bacterium]
MKKFQKIMVAYDGSTHSNTALEWAMQIGVDNGAELRVVKVFEPMLETYEGVYYSDATVAKEYEHMVKTDEQKMEDLKVFCKGVCKIKVQVELLKGYVVSTLLKYAQKNEIDLIVAGTKGHGVLGEILMGSVTGSLVSLSKAPVLIVKEQRASTQLKKIFVAYDGSEYSKAALGTAMDIGVSSGAEICTVKVADALDVAWLASMAESGAAMKLGELLAEMEEAEKKILDEAKSVAALKGIEIGTELLPSGNVAVALLQYAEKINADMIVVGTLGHGVLSELLLGSVSRNLISVSQIPVLVVKK